MKDKLTEEQIARLQTAIDKAENPGARRYVVDGRPSCVIAQLYILEGGSVDTLEWWQWQSTVIGCILEEQRPPELVHYPEGLLQNLQYLWDVGVADADTRREAMREEVAKFV